MPDKRVRPVNRKLTDADARHLLADGLIRLCHDHGPSRVAVEVGCDEKTIRRARDEESTLGLAAVVNLALMEPAALGSLFGAVGLKLTPTNAGDITRKTASCITKLMFELSVALEDDRVDDRELAAMRSSIEEVGKSIDAMRERLTLRVA